MIKPPLPSNEAERLETLRALGIMDSNPEERFDRYTRMARRLFGVPIALVSLVDGDRQWFKSCQGLSVTETPREISFCGHAILGEHVFLVNDARADARFVDNPLVSGDPHIRFYAGYPLKAPNGSKLGTLCIIDSEPRELGRDDICMLRDLAEMVERELVTLALATIDELTGLSNRRGFLAVSVHALAQCVRTQRDASLLFFDLDDFKQINDTLGHAAGDRVLTEFSALLREAFRDSDVVARLGGDEFCVLLTGASSDELEFPLQRFADALVARNEASQLAYELNYSVGAVCFDPSRHRSPEDLLRDADAYMYRQKRAKHAAQR